MVWPKWGISAMMWFWAFLIIAGYWYWWNRQRHSQRRGYWNRMDPIGHARTGVARGEISLEEFDEIKKTIRTREDRNHNPDS